MSERVEVREKRTVEVHADGARVERLASSPPGRVQLRDKAHVETRDERVAVERASSGIVGPRGESGGRLTVTAAVDLSGHRAVTPRTDDTIEYADPATIGNQPVWITTGAVAAGDDTTVVAYGDLDESSWSWDTGNIYLTANGALTQTPPSSGALVVVAEATSPTSVFVDRQPTIDL